MKLELTAHEATDLFAQLATARRVTELEELLSDARRELESTAQSRHEAWRRTERAEAEAYQLQQGSDETRREIDRLRREIKEMIERAQPYSKERGLSRAIVLFREGKLIPAIKEVRTTFHPLGLKEAKNIVEGVFQDGTQPHLFALCNVFKGIKAQHPPDELRSHLVAVGCSSELSVDNLNQILAGVFHLDTESDLKF